MLKISEGLDAWWQDTDAHIYNFEGFLMKFAGLCILYICPYRYALQSWGQDSSVGSFGGCASKSGRFTMFAFACCHLHPFAALT